MIKKHLLLAIGALCFVLPSGANAVDVGDIAPEIEAVDINGNPFKLSDHKGKTVVLEWTNAQCPYVIKHYDSGNMQKVQKEALAMENVAWVSINSSAKGKQGNVSAEEAQKVLSETGATPSAVLLDPSGAIGKAYNAKTTPHVFIVGGDGKVVYAGAVDDNSSPRQSVIADSKNYILAALGDIKEGKAIEVASTKPYGCSVKY